MRGLEGNVAIDVIYDIDALRDEFSESCRFCITSTMLPLEHKKF